MIKTDKALRKLNSIEELACRDSAIHGLHPAVKVVAAITFIAVTMSFGKLSLTGVFSMCIIPTMIMLIADIKFKTIVNHTWAALPFFMIFALSFIIFNREPYIKAGNVVITAGAIEALVLIMKGYLCIVMTFLLTATTGINNICYALWWFHLPDIIVTQFMLTCRYLKILIAEFGEMSKAYALRAPGQKGIHYKAWGPLAGSLLLRTIDKAQTVYESMLMRGFDKVSFSGKRKIPGIGDVLYLFIIISVIIIFRIEDIVQIIGTIMLKVF